MSEEQVARPTRRRRRRRGELNPPGPLSVPEQHALLADWLARHPDPVALLRASLPRVYRCAVEGGFTRDEVNQACLTGGVRAARAFDPARGTAFNTLALPYMRAEVQDLTRRQYRDNSRLGGRGLDSLDRELDANSSDTLAHMLTSRMCLPGEPERLSALARTVAAVLRRQVSCPTRRLIVELRWGLGGRKPMTLQAIGRLVGVTAERVRQISVEALERCRPDLERAYDELCTEGA